MFGEVTYKLQLFVSDVDRIIQTILITAEKYLQLKNINSMNFLIKMLSYLIFEWTPHTYRTHFNYPTFL